MLLSLILACGLLNTPDSGSSDTASSSGDTYERFCARAQECNMLDGISVDECDDDYRGMLQDCSGSAEDDWATDMEDCLDENSDKCADWLDCIEASYTWGCWEN